MLTKLTLHRWSRWSGRLCQIVALMVISSRHMREDVSSVVYLMVTKYVLHCRSGGSCMLMSLSEHWQSQHRGRLKSYFCCFRSWNKLEVCPCLSLIAHTAGDTSMLSSGAERGNRERVLFRLLLLAVRGWDEDKKWGCSLRKCQPDVIFIKCFWKGNLLRLDLEFWLGYMRWGQSNSGLIFD